MSCSFPLVLLSVCLGALASPSTPGVRSAEAESPVGLVEVFLTPAPDAPSGDALLSETTGLPLDGSAWWKHAPSPLDIQEQTGYVDNGDGVVSVGDIIELDGVAYPITAVGPAYHADAWYNGSVDDLEYSGGRVLIPGPDHDPADPQGETWTELFSYQLTMVTPRRVDFWSDGGFDITHTIYYEPNGFVDIGDRIGSCSVSVGCAIGFIYHILDVGIAIAVQDFQAVPLKPETWGGLKRRAARLGHPAMLSSYGSVHTADPPPAVSRKRMPTSCLSSPASKLPK